MADPIEAEGRGIIGGHGSKEEAQVRTVRSIGSERIPYPGEVRNQRRVPRAVQGLGSGGSSARLQPSGTDSSQDETSAAEVASDLFSKIDAKKVDARADISHDVCMNTANSKKFNRFVIRDCATNDVGGCFRVSYHGNRDGECMTLVAQTFDEVLVEFLRSAAIHGWDTSDVWRRDSLGTWSKIDTAVAS